MVAKIEVNQTNVKVEDDTFYAGGLVIDKTDGEILLVVDELPDVDSDEYFNGVLIDPGTAGGRVGQYLTEYSKSRFTKFFGSIKLTQ